MRDSHATRAQSAPIVLLHGFTQSGASWDPVRRALGGGSGLFAPDLPGHGSFAHRRPASFDAVVTYLRALGAPRFVLGGYSMGGRLALAAALALSERVAGLVLVSATAGIEDADERAARARADAELADRIERDGVAAFARSWAAQPLFAGLPRGLAASAQAERLRQVPEGLAAALRGMGTGAMTPLWHRLPELRMPVTALAGERDAKFVALGQRLAQASGGGFLAVPRAGHAVHLEQPDVVASALRDVAGPRGAGIVS